MDLASVRKQYQDFQLGYKFLCVGCSNPSHNIELCELCGQYIGASYCSPAHYELRGERIHTEICETCRELLEES